MKVAIITILASATIVILVVLLALQQSNEHSDSAKQAAIALCERSNLARSANVRFILTVERNNLSLIPSAPPEQVPIRKHFAHQYHEQAVAIANAQLAVSAHPNSPSLVQRSLVDCEKANQ